MFSRGCSDSSPLDGEKNEVMFVQYLYSAYRSSAKYHIDLCTQCSLGFGMELVMVTIIVVCLSEDMPNLL